MPKETDRLKLPLPLGNENVTRESINGIFEKIDAGVATSDELEALRQMIGEMDIPDASVTVKGKVQLSNATESTMEDRAATPKAVNDVRLAVKKYTDDKKWQKFPITQDNGQSKSASNQTNLNDLTDAGFYYVIHPVNAPEGDNVYHLEVVANVPLLCFQRATGVNSGKVFVRVRSGGLNWGTWVLQTPPKNIWGTV
jgi:hypothetical protein